MHRRILIRCEGGAIPEIGMGHLQRCLLLAEHLRKRNTDVHFMTKSSPEIVGMIRQAGHPCQLLSREADARESLETIQRLEPEIVVWDCLNTEEDLMRSIKQTGVLLITLDDLGTGAKWADITINSMVQGGETLYQGYDYCLFPKRDATLSNHSAPVQNITLSFGGYDQHHLVSRVVQALRPLDSRVQIHAILGPATALTKELEKQISNNPALRISQSPKNFSELLMASDLAILAGGLTLIEALSYGVPALAIAQSEHQRQTIQKLEQKKAVVNLGSAKEFEPERVLQNVELLLKDSERRQSLSRRARKTIGGSGLELVRELAMVIDRLDWDSQFFGLPIAYLYPQRINEDIVQYAFKKCREDAIECLYYLCDCHHPESVLLAEKHGFHFMDIRLTFFIDFEESPVSSFSVPPDVILRDVQEGDIESLTAIARESYLYSRYYFDRRFSREICRKFYSDWTTKSCKGYADKVIVAERHGTILGYIACKMTSLSLGTITLVGVAGSATGSGIGKALVQRALQWFQEQGILTVRVVTQGRNYPAQRLYQACGFKTFKTELWYHKWFRKSKATV